MHSSTHRYQPSFRAATVDITFLATILLVRPILFVHALVNCAFFYFYFFFLLFLRLSFQTPVTHHKDVNTRRYHYHRSYHRSIVDLNNTHRKAKAYTVRRSPWESPHSKQVQAH